MHKLIKKKKSHPQFGTSKLEENFAKNFLDKLGVDYTWQFEAKDIGRFFDFYIEGLNCMIEVDGGYWHSDPRLFEGKKLNPTQKHNKFVDKVKDTWCALHGIPLIRIWEKDIIENPKMVMEMLKEKFGIAKNKADLKKEFNKRHVNKLNSNQKEDKD